MVAAAGTMVGKRVSITIRSGHRCEERSRMEVRSTSTRSDLAAEGGMYQSATNSSASSMQPVKAKYRPRGMSATVVMKGPSDRDPTGKTRSGFLL